MISSSGLMATYSKPSIMESVISLEGIELAKACANFAHDKKASNILTLDVSSLTSYTDYFVICSGQSERQVSAIARNIQTGLKNAGADILGIEGLNEGLWVLIDCGDTICHIFHEDLRMLYDLEGLWSDAPRVEIELNND